MAPGKSAGLQVVELVCRDTFVFQHYRDIVIDTVYPLTVLGDQPLCEGLGNDFIPGVGDVTAGNFLIDLLQLGGTQGPERLLAHWATQNLKQLSVYGHVKYQSFSHGC